MCRPHQLFRAVTAAAGGLDDEDVAGVHLHTRRSAQFLDAPIGALDGVAPRQARAAAYTFFQLCV